MTARRRARVVAVALLAPALVACTQGGAGTSPPDGRSPSTGTDELVLEDLPALRDLAGDDLLVGAAAAGGGHHVDAGTPDPFVADDRYREVLATQFSSVTPENQLKWEALRPSRDTFDFAAADAVVDFAERHGMSVRGHTLLWHSQLPGWVTEGDPSPDELRALLREHVTTVVGRYAGRIREWDVANEVIGDDGRLRAENPFVAALGEQAIADAFRWAHEADPDALLFLNDYGVERVGRKSDAYLDLARRLLDDGVPVHGFGVQGHLTTTGPAPHDLAENLRRFEDLGLVTAVTELDVRAPVADGPTDDALLEQAERFRDVVAACLDVESCTSVTFWGVSDAHSWVPAFFPDEGAATLLAEGYALKPAFVAVSDALAEGRAD